jgi:predicted TIM-barrel fold metal-dependent hydrolase
MAKSAASLSAGNRLGLPDLAYLKAMNIWDSYLTISYRGEGEQSLEKVFERLLPMIDAAAMQRLCPILDIGLDSGSSAAAEAFARNAKVAFKAFERWPDRLLGMIKLNANNVPASLAALDRWVRDGSMVAIYFSGGSRSAALACSHPNFDPLVQRIGELGAMIMQHTWRQTGGKGNDVGTSTPAELAELAARHPTVKFVCAHAGGEWEQGLRAVRGSPNILVETSGFDPTAGFIEMAVRELGAERIVFGSHFPSRSLGTEYSKVFHAQISEREKKLIMGENLRNLLRPILSKKGIRM